MTAPERQKLGRCWADMVVDPRFDPADAARHAKMSRHVYRFHRSDRSALTGHISTGEPVTVSVDNGAIALARGFVLELTPFHAIVGLDYAIEQYSRARGPDTTRYRIDKDELAAGMGRVRDNLAQLFYADGDVKRRRLVVDLEPPEFNVQPVGLHANDVSVSSNLNVDQKEAIQKVLSARDYALILGMPGTGKTHTVAEIIKSLVQRGKSVLLTSYQHSAVDNILLKIKDSDMSILRLGNRDKVSMDGY
jgi:DNA replication ATP-dependent helicase Dna2